jgi:hypothetical protein
MSGSAYLPDVLPPPGKTQLVVQRGLEYPLSLYRESDTRTALARGVKEYLEQLELPWPGGRTERFRQVFDTWAEPEDDLKYPCACVYAAGRTVYGGGGTKDSPLSPDVFTVNGFQVARTTEVVVTLMVEMWAQDPQQREILMALAEDAMNPVEWMYGFHLVLPHYHGVVASYAAVDSGYLDDEGDAARRYRKGTFVVEARMAQLRVLAPSVRMRTRAELQFNGEAEPSRVAGTKLVNAPDALVTNS